MNPIADAAHRLRAIRAQQQAGAAGPREPAAPERADLEALAGAAGLLAALLARDAEQLESVQNVLAEFEQNAALPARVVLTAALLIARHTVGEHEEAAQVIGVTFSEAHQAAAGAAGAAGAGGDGGAAAYLVGAGRLLLLTATWLDAEGAHGELLARAQGVVYAPEAAPGSASTAAAGEVYTAGVTALGRVLLPAWQPDHEGAAPLATAFERTLAICLTAAGE